MNFIEHVLVIVMALSFFVINSYLGFLAVTIGEHRMNKNEKTNANFALLYQKSESRIFEAYKKGDSSVVAGILLFGHVGIPLFFLIVFGPKGNDKWIESKVKLK